MEDLGRIHQLIVDLSGYKMTFNLDVVLMTWIVIIGLLVFGYLATRNRKLIPGPLQSIGEMFVFQFYSLTEDALGEDMARTYGPLIIALFMFLLFCDWIGMIPHMHEPTNDLNTPLSLGIMGFVIAHYAGIKHKGIKEYTKDYFKPIFFMAPLNIIGELAKVVSISFRLFGNIMGGSIIILVVSYLTFSLVLPPFLNLFFVIFIGAIQAFVFTMLTLVYIAVQVN
ncbi:MAG: F0F1 ATP synthase subunit A [Thermodesulfobacteriota bacterium]